MPVFALGPKMTKYASDNHPVQIILWICCLYSVQLILFVPLSIVKGSMIYILVLV